MFDFSKGREQKDTKYKLLKLIEYVFSFYYEFSFQKSALVSHQ